VLTIYGGAQPVGQSIRNEMQAYASAGAIAEEVLAGVRTVHAFCAQDFEVGRYSQCLQSAQGTGIRKNIVISAAAGAYLLILFSAMGIAFLYGTTLVFAGVMTPGSVFAVFWSCIVGAMRIGMALPQLNVVVSAKMAAGEIFSIIDRKPKMDCVSKAGIRLEK